jgi:hypothetical protein
MIRMLLLTTLILLSTTGIISGQTKPEVNQPADLRDELRYDGKPFSYWQTFSLTELKAEKRIDALRALAAFGARRYPKEATAAIVELLKDYDNDEAAFGIDSSAPEKGTPDQRVIHESLWALSKIGPDASPVLLAHLDHQAVRVIAGELFVSKSYPIAITDSSVPVLVRWTQSKDGEIRDAAISILGTAIANEPKGKKTGPTRQSFSRP